MAAFGPLSSRRQQIGAVSMRFSSLPLPANDPHCDDAQADERPLRHWLILQVTVSAAAWAVIALSLLYAV
jgi:hypothetical protein